MATQLLPLPRLDQTDADSIRKNQRCVDLNFKRLNATGGSVSGSGTLNYIPLFTPDGATLGSSIASQSGTTITVAGSLTATSTLTAVTLSATGNGTVGGTLLVTGALTNTALAGADTRLVTASSTGVLSSTTASAYGLVSGAGSGVNTRIAYWVGTGSLSSNASFLFDGTTFSVGSTTITVSSGNTSVAGTLAVTGVSSLTGNVGIGGASNGSYRLQVFGTGLTGTAQYGTLSYPTFSSAATSSGVAFQAQLVTAASAFTMGIGIGVEVGTPSLGAGSAVTTLYGIKVADQTGGGTNYALYTGAGLVRFGGAVSMASTLGVTGVSTLTGNVNINGATNTTGYGLNVNGGDIATTGVIRSFGLGGPSEVAAGNTEILSVRHTGAEGQISVSKTGTGTFHDFVIYTSDAERYRVTAAGAHTLTGAVTHTSTLQQTGVATFSADASIAGRLGIKDTSPSFDADVAGNGRIQGTNFLYFGGTGAADTVGYMHSSGAGSLTIKVPNGESNGFLYLNDLITLDGSGSSIVTDGNIRPNSSGFNDIGSTSFKYQNLYLSGAADIGGDLTVSRSSSGVTVIGTIKNTSNTANSAAKLLLQNGGTSGGDAYLHFYDSTENWSLGADKSAGSLVLSYGSVPGTGNVFEVINTLAVTFFGLLQTKASATGGAGLRLPHGAAPTAPVDGDIWTTSAGLFVQINGVTKTVTLT